MEPKGTPVSPVEAPWTPRAGGLLSAALTLVLLLGAGLFAEGAEPGKGRPLEVRLSVTEPAGVPRRAEPISGGIPLPKGRFTAGRAFALFEGDREVPLQVLPLVIDEKGFLRWILLDFQADLAPNEAKAFTLKSVGGPATLTRPLKVTRDGGVTVDTGRIRFTIADDRSFSLFTSVAAHAVVEPPPWPGSPAHMVAPGRVVVAGGEVSYTDGLSGKRYVGDKPTSIEVEYAGPLRATVCVRGRFVGDETNRFQYVARITAWAGKSAVHVKYSLANSNPDHYCYRTVKDSSIALQLAGKPSGSILGASKPLEAGPDAWLAQSLSARTAGSAKAASGGKVVWVSEGETDVAEGWIAVKLPRSTIQVCDLYFASDPARRLAIDKGSLRLSGVVERWKNTETDRSGRDVGRPYNLTKRVMHDCSHLSSQYLIDFDGSLNPEHLSATCRRAKDRLWLFATPEWYLRRAEALPLGRYATQADEIACYKTWGWKYDGKNAPEAPSKSYPRYFRGTDAHYTPEEDVVDQLLIMYLRTGRRSYFDSARSWVNYSMDTYAWRTDGWRFKDGGVWWYGGPLGNRPVRTADPVTGRRNGIPPPWSKPPYKAPWIKEFIDDVWFVSNAKGCYCHNWAEGLFHWYCLTGDRDALEAGIDRVEQDYSHLQTAVPGKTDAFSRNFNRASYNAHAGRTAVPNDEFLRTVSDFFAQVYLQRPTREPRGLVNAPRMNMYEILGGKLFREGTDAERRAQFEKWLKGYVGDQGVAEMRRLGLAVDFKTGHLIDPKTGARWLLVVAPHTWMFPPLSRAMERYYVLTGSEDAMDWTIAYGQAAAHLIYQRHGVLTYGKMLADFPRRGVVKDWASWVTKPDNTYAEGIKLSGFLARFHPDVCARAYSLCGEPFLKERARDFWFGGSHRGYQAEKMRPADRVGQWINYYSDHDGQVDFVGRTFYEWAHPRRDARPPKAVTDLKVTMDGETARVTFTAPTDMGGGKVVRYQVKCSDRPIVDYGTFLEKFNNFEDDAYCNWWMATNLTGESVPADPGTRESFTVAGVPKNARYFAVRSFDDSSNRSAISNVAGAG